LARIQNMPLHHSAAIETLVLDDAPIEVRLAVLPPFGSSKEHNDVDSITKTIPWESGRSSLQAFLTILPVAHTFQIKYLRTKKIVKPAFPPANPRSRARANCIFLDSNGMPSSGASRHLLPHAGDYRIHPSQVAGAPSELAGKRTRQGHQEGALRPDSPWYSLITGGKQGELAVSGPVFAGKSI